VSALANGNHFKFSCVKLNSARRSLLMIYAYFRTWHMFERERRGIRVNMNNSQSAAVLSPPMVLTDDDDDFG
jgi:hypothetical protein